MKATRKLRKLNSRLNEAFFGATSRGSEYEKGGVRIALEPTVAEYAKELEGIKDRFDEMKEDFEDMLEESMFDGETYIYFKKASLRLEDLDEAVKEASKAMDALYSEVKDME